MFVQSIYQSIEGECTADGPLQWTTFIRLGGCNLRCYESSGGCDTPQALTSESSKVMSIRSIVNQVMKTRIRRVTITGGEPLTQKGTVELARSLWRAADDLVLSIETNGSIHLSRRILDAFHCVVMDLKPPSTGVEKTYRPKNFRNLRLGDYVKAVIADKADFEWVRRFLSTHKTQAHIAVSPKWGLDPQELVEWMRETLEFDWRLNLQLHKYIWPETVKDLTLER